MKTKLYIADGNLAVTLWSQTYKTGTTTIAVLDRTPKKKLREVTSILRVLGFEKTKTLLSDVSGILTLDSTDWLASEGGFAGARFLARGPLAESFLETLTRDTLNLGELSTQILHKQGLIA